MLQTTHSSYHVFPGTPSPLGAQACFPTDTCKWKKQSFDKKKKTYFHTFHPKVLKISVPSNGCAIKIYILKPPAAVHKNSLCLSNDKSSESLCLGCPHWLQHPSSPWVVSYVFPLTIDIYWYICMNFCQSQKALLIWNINIRKQGSDSQIIT